MQETRRLHLYHRKHKESQYSVANSAESSSQYRDDYLPLKLVDNYQQKEHISSSVESQNDHNSQHFHNTNFAKFQEKQ